MQQGFSKTYWMIIRELRQYPATHQFLFPVDTNATKSPKRFICRTIGRKLKKHKKYTMKTRLILSILLFFCHNISNGQNHTAQVGGLLTYKFKDPIPLFKNESDTIPFDTLSFYVDPIGKTKFITGRLQKDIIPYRLSEGDSYEEGRENINMGLVRFLPILMFRVVDTTGSSYKIYLNEKTLETAFIKKMCSTCFVFETWQEYLGRVEFIEKDSIVIYNKPEGELIFKNKSNKFLPFRVIEVNGDWIKLGKGIRREFNFENGVNYNGWTKWKEGEKIIINIVEQTYE